jgi:hypothetical protein
MHRAVLLAVGAEIDVEAIRLPDGQPLSAGSHGAAGYDNPAARAAQTADAVTRAHVGQTVAQMEKTLILDTLSHCLGNRTHAANILGISIRTLRNKLNEYADEGVQIIAPPAATRPPDHDHGDGPQKRPDRPRRAGGGGLRPVADERGRHHALRSGP